MYIEPDVSPLPDENSNTKRRYGGPTLKEKGFQVPSSRGNLLFSRHYDSQPSEVYDQRPSRDADSIQWCARNGAKGKAFELRVWKEEHRGLYFLFSFFSLLTLFFQLKTFIASKTLITIGGTYNLGKSGITKGFRLFSDKYFCKIIRFQFFVCTHSHTQTHTERGGMHIYTHTYIRARACVVYYYPFLFLFFFFISNG